MRTTILNYLSDAIRYYLLSAENLGLRIEAEDAEQLKLIAKKLQDGRSEESKSIQTNQSSRLD